MQRPFGDLGRLVVEVVQLVRVRSHVEQLVEGHAAEIPVRHCREFGVEEVTVVLATNEA